MTFLFYVCAIYIISPVISSSVYYVDNGRATTVPYEFKTKDKHRFRSEIQQLFGLETIPKAPRNFENLVSSYMYSLLKLVLKTNDDADMLLTPNFSYLESSAYPTINKSDSLFNVDRADTVMSFTDRASANNVYQTGGGEFRRLIFDLSDVKPYFELIGAELRIVRNVSSNFYRVGTLNVYSPRSSDINGEFELVLVAVAALEPSSTWLVLNVTSAFELWMQNPAHGHEFLLEVLNIRGEPESPADYGIQNAFMIGFLNSVIYEMEQSRKKRSTVYDDDVSPRSDYYYGDILWPRTTCQLRTFFVSFQTLNWDNWIIAPIGYNAYYCHGECSFPLTSSLNATNHAIVQTLLHIMNPSAVPKPCCAPTRMSKVGLLFYDETQNVVLKQYEHMIVNACGCH